MGKFNKLIATSRTTEVNAVGTKIIFEYDKNDWSADAHLTAIFDGLKAKNAILTSAINRIKAESVLEEKDEVRDEKVRAIYYLIFGFTHHPDVAIKTAALKLDAIFEHYGLQLISKSYAIETSLIDSLMLEFEKADLQPSIAALPGLTQLIAELTAAELDFKTANVKFEEEKAEEGIKENASTVKKEVVSIINEQIVIYLRAMIQVDEPTYGELTRTSAQIIDDNNVIVNKRKKKVEPVVSN
jgi:Family of unknown function (DUF6261)